MFTSLPARAAALAIVALALTAPLVAAAQPADMQLETGPNNRTLRLGDVAWANQISVTFQDANKSYLRWSDDGGASFTPRHVLRDGLRAKNPRVAACGDQIWVASEWQSDAHQNVGVDVFDTQANTSVKFRPARDSSKPDVACLGGIVAVTYWSADHAFVDFYHGACIHSCVFSRRDLGPADFDNPARVAATDDGFAVSWLTTSLNVQHFQVSAGVAQPPHVVAGPLVTLNSDVSAPVVAADGSRVVVAYSRLGQTHMRISDDYGATFGPRIIVSSFCRDCPEGGSQPMGIDARDGNILVEVLSAGGAPPDYSAVGFLTQNDGATWSQTPDNRGQKFGVLHGDKLAEAWDDSLARGFPYPSRPQVIMFHVRDI